MRRSCFPTAGQQQVTNREVIFTCFASHLVLPSCVAQSSIILEVSANVLHIYKYISCRIPFQVALNQSRAMPRAKEQSHQLLLVPSFVDGLCSPPAPQVQAQRCSNMVKADDSNLGLLTSKALTLMLQGSVCEEMRVRRAARKHVRPFLGLSFPEQQRILAGSNVFVFRGGGLRRGGG